MTDFIDDPSTIEATNNAGVALFEKLMKDIEATGKEPRKVAYTVWFHLTGVLIETHWFPADLINEVKHHARQKYGESFMPDA